MPLPLATAKMACGMSHSKKKAPKKGAKKSTKKGTGYRSKGKR